jgi:hypothetical protein
MLVAIIKRLKSDTYGLSNVIVVMLSLVLIVVIVSNVVLWSYQMNQIDWEKMQENIRVTSVTRISRSSWFVASREYNISTGSLVNGTYKNTQTTDGAYETFSDSPDLTGTFNLGLSNYPLAYTKGVEIQLLYRASGSGDKWYLKAYNWTSGAYSNLGFNNTSGDTPTADWKIYAVNLTDKWTSYVNTSGIMYVELLDNQTDTKQATIDIDFLGVAVDIDGAKFSLENDGSVTSHIVAIWVINATLHERYDADFFMSLGENSDYARVDTELPLGSFIVEVATERGNIAVFKGSS